MTPSTGRVASSLTQALTITHDMLTAARRDDWEQLVHLQQAREPLLRRQHPADPVSRAQIQQILAYDHQLQALLGKARDAVAQRWQDERDRVRAIAAYVQP